jgi:hypothetical protein
MKYETYYCPCCESENFFRFEHKKRFETWAFCRDCHYKAPLADFDPDYNDYEGQAADDWVHEYINEHWNN